MKILVFSDMHGNRRAVDVARTIIEKDGFDMVVYLGDFSGRVGDAKSNIEDAEYLISRLSELAEVKSIFGNCDSKELQDFLEEHKVTLHNQLMFKGKTAIVGWGGSHPTPFHTPSEFSESEIESSLEKLMDEAASKGAEQLILFTHEPPARTNGDKLPSGHVGSDALRHMIESHQPNLNVCGHIHEAKSTDHIKNTKVINVGPASDGHYLVVTLDGEIKTEEINI